MNTIDRPSHPTFEPVLCQKETQEEIQRADQRADQRAAVRCAEKTAPVLLAAATLLSLGSVSQQAIAQPLPSAIPALSSSPFSTQLPTQLPMHTLGQTLGHTLGQTAAGAQVLSPIPEEQVTRFGTLIIFTGLVVWVISLCNGK